MSENKNVIKDKSELLFLYENSYSMPNGDPFTGEQRYDEETKKILVSDVRIKRFIRDFLEGQKNLIYVSDKTGAGKTSAAGVIKHLYEKTFEKKIDDVQEILKKCIDVRLFGGIATLKDKEATVANVKLKNAHTQFTGPVQFSLLNPSLNKVNMRMHQNTTHFTSSEDKKQGSIGTTTLVPYSLVQIHGWINPLSAIETEMTTTDEAIMFKALWHSVNDINTRTKHGDSVFVVQIVYKNNYNKIYGIDRLIEIKAKDEQKTEEAFRSRDDFNIDFSEFAKAVKTEKVKEIKYYTEIEELEVVFRKQLGLKDENNNKATEIEDKDKYKISVTKFNFKMEEKKNSSANETK